tara:strand:- start:3835 stop:4158 length:324 start_codon:yes stop_codon:yes gene_type:complete
MRFEIVSASVETQIQQTLQTHAERAVETITTLIDSIQNTTNKSLNRTFNVLQNETKMKDFYNTVSILLSPNSLPGALLVCACVLKLVHTFIIHLFARKARDVAKKLA